MGNNVIKIANCSGYYGDKLSAAKEMEKEGAFNLADMMGGGEMVE